MKKEMRYLVPGDYMADPAVHVFNGRVYIGMIIRFFLIVTMNRNRL